MAKTNDPSLRRSRARHNLSELPSPLSIPDLYNRKSRVPGDAYEYFLTDFIQLENWNDLKTVMELGTKVRAGFEKKTTWQLVLSGYCQRDRTCEDDHGLQILNLWRITTGDLDSIPNGLEKVMTHNNTTSQIDLGMEFGRLIDFFREEHHFITFSTGRRFAEPDVKAGLKIPRYVPAFVYVEYWPSYDDWYGFVNDFTTSLKSFEAPWQFIANVRAISGRVNTFSQYWLRMVPSNWDHRKMEKEIRREVMGAGWHREKYRPQRVDLLTPTAYDPTTHR